MHEVEPIFELNHQKTLRKRRRVPKIRHDLCAGKEKAKLAATKC
jgi:hypothetical protein